MMPRQSSQRPRRTLESQTEYRMVCGPAQPAEQGPASSRRITEPELPASKRGRGSQPPASDPAPSSKPSPEAPFEVWRVKGVARRRLKAFETLQDALEHVRTRDDNGRYDIRLPDGKWFSESRTIRLPQGK